MGRVRNISEQGVSEGERSPKNRVSDTQIDDFLFAMEVDKTNLGSYCDRDGRDIIV